MLHACLLVFLLLPSDRASAVELRWISRSGTVELFPRGSKEPLPSAELPRSLETGDRLRVGNDSSAGISLSEGAPLIFGPDSDLTLQYDGAFHGVLTLESGSVRADPVQERSPLEEPQVLGTKRAQGPRKGTLILKTLAAEVSPRDAVFTMQVEGDSGLRLVVLGGDVQLRTSQGRRMVKAGQRISVDAGGRLAPLRSPGGTGPQATKARVRAAPSAKPTRVRTPQDIDGLLDAIHRDPDDADSRLKLKAAVTALYLDHKQRYEAIAKPLDLADRQAILRRAYANMAAQVEDEAVRTIFGDGQAAFEKGHYLLAALHLTLCRLMNPAEVWLRGAISDYLERQIPRAVAATPYRSGFEAIVRLDWRRALKESESLSPGDSQMKPLLRRLKKISSGDPAARVDQGPLLDLLRSADTDPTESVEMIEHVLLLHHAENGAPWWQKAAEGLRRAYGNRDIARTLEQARRIYKTGDVKETMSLLVRVLQKSPGNPQALGMLEGMQARAKAEGTMAATQAAGKPLVVIPDIKDIVQSEAYYNRGLKAYVQGDLKGAAAEWRTSTKLYPANERSQKALARVLKELGGSAGEAAKP